MKLKKLYRIEMVKQDGKYILRLWIDNQGFDVGGENDTKEEAFWVRKMLIKALERLIRKAGTKDVKYQFIG